jgi:rhamnulokinase
MSVVAAIDCGATSVRVCRVDLDARPLVPEVVYRVANSLVRDAAGHLRWNWAEIVGAVVEGLERCLAVGPIDSIGVDTWAVDYGLLDDDGTLIGDPYSYRDHRTDGYRRIVDEFGAAEMYRINGLQLQPFNTIFQLAAHDQAELHRAARVVWLPELVAHELAGRALTERTSAGTSGLVDQATGDWSPELCAIAGVDPAVLGTIDDAGTLVGEWRGVPVHLVGGHDTASAVVGMGPTSVGGSAFIASGTWMLVGIERNAADTSDWAIERNFTNEAGALGGIRFLRNVTGLWLLEQCRTQWSRSLPDLLEAAGGIDGPAPVVDVDQEDLRAPADMLSTYETLAGLATGSDPVLVTRSIVESIAQRTAVVIDQLAEVSAFDDVVLFGGAARIDLLHRRIAELSGRTVRLGSAEAAALGNAVVQGIALGTFSTPDEGRRAIVTQEPLP